MSQVTSPTTTPTVAPATKRVNGELRLTYPTRGYAVSRNPFTIGAILPAIVLSFCGLAIWNWVGEDVVLTGGSPSFAVMDITVVTFIIVTLGLLLIPAMTLHGSINLTHDGITFEHGNENFTAAWDQVQGLEYRRDCGLCLVLTNPQQTKPVIKMPGGLFAGGGVARIPLRMFGDRMYSIIYDIRDRVPMANYQPALSAVHERSALNIQLVYGMAALFSILAVIVTFLVYS